MKFSTGDRIRSLVPLELKNYAFKLLTTPVIGSIIKKLKWVRSKQAMIFVDHPRISKSEAVSIFLGIRERAEVDIVINRLRIDPRTTVIELGASIGVVSSQVVKRQPKRVICIEADPELIDICRINVNRNIVDETEIVFLNQAIDYSETSHAFFKSGATTTSGKLFVSESSTNAPSSLPQNNRQETSHSDQILSIETSTLSGILLRYCVDDYILISDIEGAECDIWFSDASALRQCQAILVELEDMPARSIYDQVKRLQQLGFTLHYQYGRVYYFSKY